MKTALEVILLLLSAGVWSARGTPTPEIDVGAPTVEPTSDQKLCKDLKIELTITSTNFIFGLDHFKNNLDVAHWVGTASNRNPSIKATVTSRTETITANYTIGATFCQPAPGRKSNKVVLLATHGIGFDRSYWDPDLEDKTRYSFVNHAISKGYSVFSYDRLGVGSSTHASGYTVQTSNQLEILKVLTKKVKSGKKDVLPRGFGKPSKTVLVGHSFGSALSYYAVSDEPELVDGVVLTGFSTNVSASNHEALITGFAPRIAKLQKEKWKHLDSGYLTTVDEDSSAVVFFQQPDYDPAVAKFATKHRAPFSVMELSTISSREFSLNPPVTFRGAALIITGQYDWPYCAGDCGDALENPASAYFASACQFKAIVYPKAGHGLNLHLNAKGSFKAITEFLKGNGIE